MSELTITEKKLLKSASKVLRFAADNLRDQILPWLRIVEIEVEAASMSDQHEEAQGLLIEARERIERALNLLNDA